MKLFLQKALLYMAHIRSVHYISESVSNVRDIPTGRTLMVCIQMVCLVEGRVLPSWLLHLLVYSRRFLHVLVSRLFVKLKPWMFIGDIIDAIEEVLDDCLSRLVSWILNRLYGSLTIFVYMTVCVCMILLHGLCSQF
jgi:hypothetical protein